MDGDADARRRLWPSTRDVRGSLMRLFSRLVCSSGLTSSQYLIKMMPESIIAFSKAGRSPSISPRSGSGSAISFHDPQDRL